MAACELKIVLDDDRTAFRGGETVSGVVEVRTDAEVRCKALTVDCHWQTHGKGTRVRGDSRETTLFQGTWRADTRQQYAFSFQLPHGPFTYQGYYLNLAWFIRARADIPWALDPKAETEIAVTADPTVEPQWSNLVASVTDLPGALRDRILDPVEASGPPAQASKVGNLLGIGCLAVFAIPVFGLIAVSVYQGVQLAQGKADPLEALIWIGVTLVLVSGMARGPIKWLRNRWAKKRLGDITFDVEPLMLRAGESLSVRVGCRPAKSTVLQRALVRLEAEERVTSGSGTNRKTSRRRVYEHEELLPLDRALPAGLPFQHDIELRLPADAASSFIARDNRLDWTVTLDLDIPRWPDWSGERAILVHP
jgi:hypothetical protein